MSLSDRGAQLPTPDDLGARVRSAREQAGLSMRALARISGVSQPFLSMVEHGKSAPSLATLYRIAAALNIAPVALMPGDPGDDRAPTVAYIRSGEGRRIRVSEATNSAVGTVLSASPGLEVVEYRVQPGEDLGGWFTSSGVQTLTVVEGQVRLELEGLGVWELSTGDTLTHPSDVAHRWSVGAGQRAHLILAVAR